MNLVEAKRASDVQMVLVNEIEFEFFMGKLSRVTLIDTNGRIAAVIPKPGQYEDFKVFVPERFVKAEPETAP